MLWFGDTIYVVENGEYSTLFSKRCQLTNKSL